MEAFEMSACREVTLFNNYEKNMDLDELLKAIDESDYWDSDLVYELARRADIPEEVYGRIEDIEFVYNFALTSLDENKFNNTIAKIMDNDLREELHRELAPCSCGTFLANYIEKHREKFGEEDDFLDKIYLG